MTSDDTWHMTWQQQVGSLALMAVIAACIIMGLWLVVKDINRDRDHDAEQRLLRLRLWLFSQHYYRSQHPKDSGVRTAMLRARAKR